MTTQVTWYGHAALGIETGGKFLLFDPYLTGNQVATVKPDALNPGYILISHGHGDHVGDAPDIAKRTGAMLISNFEICSWLETKHGHGSVHAQHIGGGFNYDFGRVKLIGPRVVIPIHYNTFDLLTQDAHEWARRVSSASQDKTQVVVLSPGQSFSL